jgi:hypothetical protein
MYRIFVKHIETRSEALIVISREILNDVLDLVSKCTASIRAACDVAWNICSLAILLPFRSRPIFIRVFLQYLSSYRLPTAGVLAIELLRQTKQSQTRTQNQNQLLPSPSSPSSTPIPSSQATQPFPRSVAANDAKQAPDWLGTGAGAGPMLWQDDGTDLMKWIDDLDWGQEPWVGFS